MGKQSPVFFQDENKIVDEVITQVGDTINLATPLAVGKANHIINAFYRKAKEDPSINLTIMTALTLERPKGKSLLEKRFLEPFVERVFGDYPDLDFELDRVNNALPENVRVNEFYFPAGKFLKNMRAQQDYICSNYTHVARDLMDRGANIIAQLVAPGEMAGDVKYSLSSNPDVTLDLIREMQLRGEREGVPFAIIGQVNPNLPFMYGDAIVDAANFHFILDKADYYYKLFGPPKMSVPEREHMIGLYLSSLIRDEGELQVGIGALGDAFVNAMILRQNDNQKYKQVLQTLEIEKKFGQVIKKIGDTGILEKGLFGATEMVVDGFLHLYKAGILKRVVYDDLPIQRLLNQGLIGHKVTPDTLDLLLKHKAVHMHLSRSDFDYLVDYGVFKEGMIYDEGFIETAQGQRICADFTSEENRQLIMDHCLGDQLKRGAVVHGGFFLGPQDFYQGLKQLSDQERRLFNMRSVQRINQLYGHEEIDRLQRKNARFVNTCMKVTLLGNIVSDGFDDGRVVSGVGGQYNFVSMAHALPDGRSLINLRATREKGTKTRSNIVWNYGHTTIPRHLRDIVVTEYGIADLRGKTDSEIIEELLKVTDSRFQAELMGKAKRAGKLRNDYQIPEQFRNNYPHVISQKMEAFNREGLFPPFPFGTDFTEEEQLVGKALKSLKRKSKSKWLLLRMLVNALFTLKIPKEQIPYLERMGLWRTTGLKEKIFRNLLANELKEVLNNSSFRVAKRRAG